MAKEVVHLIKDDINGEDGAQPVTFAWRGRDYEIDLSEANAAKLEAAQAAAAALIQAAMDKAEKQLAQFIGAAHAPEAPVKGPKRGRVARTDADAKEDTTALREWAIANGYTIAARGRVKAEIKEAYRANRPASGVAVAPMPKRSKVAAASKPRNARVTAVVAELVPVVVQAEAFEAAPES